MTKINFSLALNDTCSLTIQDNTGFTTTNPTTGFILESAPTIPIDSYKLTNGYFKTVILYNKYGVTSPLVINSQDEFRKITSVSSNYISNFPAQVYKLVQDGVFTVKRIFIPSLEFYNAEKNTGRFTGRIIFYTDGIDIYRVTGSTPNKVTLEDYLSTVDPFTGLITDVTFVSTCYINTCYFNILTALIVGGLDACSDTKNNGLVSQRDYLYMVLEVIKYLKETGNTSEIQRIIQATTTCGGICKSVAVTSDCGCNG